MLARAMELITPAIDHLFSRHAERSTRVNNLDYVSDVRYLLQFETPQWSPMGLGTSLGTKRRIEPRQREHADRLCYLNKLLRRILVCVITSWCRRALLFVYYSNNEVCYVSGISPSVSHMGKNRG
ncbi:hypothetical protein AVEN_60518-1 [Araneus ventricosus]|uniref:Uncharacterized protein n=1 Tax=Araneus ventricosus TaxID=182803 RepID=A0A4Y2FTD1_ARAVE|nr:hypothetical protein AVEN_60518-1 [Araneus ventricosus]